LAQVALLREMPAVNNLECLFGFWICHSKFPFRSPYLSESQV
jgi:hypothetical protein